MVPAAHAFGVFAGDDAPGESVEFGVAGVVGPRGRQQVHDQQVRGTVGLLAQGVRGVLVVDRAERGPQVEQQPPRLLRDLA